MKSIALPCSAFRREIIIGFFLLLHSMKHLSVESHINFPSSEKKTQQIELGTQYVCSWENIIGARDESYSACGLCIITEWSINGNHWNFKWISRVSVWLNIRKKHNFEDDRKIFGEWIKYIFLLISKATTSLCILQVCGVEKSAWSLERGSQLELFVSVFRVNLTNNSFKKAW